MSCCTRSVPTQLRLMSVDEKGDLTARPEGYTVNMMDKPNRMATMAALTANEKFLLAGTTFDEPAKPNPDGSPILWVERNGTPHSVASSVPDPDGMVVFPVGAYGPSVRPSSRTAAAPRGTCSSCSTGDDTSRALNGTVSRGRPSAPSWTVAGRQPVTPAPAWLKVPCAGTLVR